MKKQEKEKINGSEVVQEMARISKWEIEENFARDVLKKYYDLGNKYDKWGKEHADMMDIVFEAKIKSLDQRMIQPYLQSIKCNSGACMDKSIVEELGQILTMLIAIYAGIASGHGCYRVSFLVCLFYVVIYAIVSGIANKYSYRDRFYDKVIDGIKEKHKKDEYQGNTIREEY